MTEFRRILEWSKKGFKIYKTFIFGNLVKIIITFNFNIIQLWYWNQFSIFKFILLYCAVTSLYIYISFYFVKFIKFYISIITNVLQTVIVIHDTGTMIRSNKFESPIQINRKCSKSTLHFKNLRSFFSNIVLI